MTRTFSAKSPLQLVTTFTIVAMCLNIFLPLNLSRVEAEATEYPFTLITTLEKTAYKTGELVNVTLTLINIGEENVTLYTTRDEFDFVIHDEHFIRVFRYGRYILVPQCVLPWSIPPNGNTTEMASWKQIYDYAWRKQVPPGIYYLTGIFGSLTYDVQLQTPPIRITIIGG